jgi:sec-independent protein translocase protein TatA
MSHTSEEKVMGLSIGHLLVILVIVVLLFGTSRLKNLGGDLGTAIRNFKTAMKDGEKDSEKKLEDKSADRSVNSNVTSDKKDNV